MLPPLKAKPRRTLIERYSPLALTEEKLKILFLIPHPFYQDRGSPIADDLILQALSARGDQVDVVTYYEGTNRNYQQVSLYRTIKVPFVQNVRPGFSWKKIVYDVLLFMQALRLMLTKRYDLVHAVEESVFMALLLKAIFKIEYVYDMDSSLAQQMTEKYPRLGWLQPVFNFFEKIAIRNAKCVIPVCKALADDIAMYRPRKVAILPDVSLLKQTSASIGEDLKHQLGINSLLLMYVGNLESYQGIDLLLASLALVLPQAPVNLAIVGGEQTDIQHYHQQARRLGIHRSVHFLGAKPARELGAYLAQADILVSPRIKGKNTPMKIYSYLDSGKPVVATALSTHTQVLSERVAMLAHPTPEDFAEAILTLVHHHSLRLKLGTAGKRLVQQQYTYTSFCQKLNNLYDWLKSDIAAHRMQARYKT
ncbi:MAG: glycosyltransferase [Cyanophyceae cyanobacterium]